MKITYFIDPQIKKFYKEVLPAKRLNFVSYKGITYAMILHDDSIVIVDLDLSGIEAVY